MSKVLVVNGPNLNLLGKREPEIYGSETLDDLNKILFSMASDLNIDIKFYQSNAEHKLIECIHQASELAIDFIILNPAAFTHTSVAIRDALLAVSIPFIEVHLSNTYAREDFRSHSWFSDIAVGTISGLGGQGYLAALQYINATQTSNTN